MRLTYRKQQRSYWCGPACAQMLLAANGRRLSQAMLASRMHTNARVGTSRHHLVRGLRTFGLAVAVTRAGNLERLQKHLPAIVSYQASDGEDHYAVVVRIDQRRVHLFDPWEKTPYALTRHVFLRRWKNPKIRKKYTGWFVALR